MRRGSRIRVAGVEVGLFPESLPLNPRFRPNMQRIKLEVDIEWQQEARVGALGEVEEALVEISPNLRRHECRGQPEYRILRAPGPRGASGEDGGEPIEIPLALAHLLEHLMIDAVAALTGEPLVSGATGARWDSRRRFDIFVECPDDALAPLVVRLSVDWMRAAIAGRRLDGTGRPALELAQDLYARAARGLDTKIWARRRGRDPRQVESALRWLEKNGFVRREETRVYYSLVEPRPRKHRPRRR